MPLYEVQLIAQENLRVRCLSTVFLFASLVVTQMTNGIEGMYTASILCLSVVWKESILVASIQHVKSFKQKETHVQECILDILHSSRIMLISCHVDLQF